MSTSSNNTSTPLGTSSPEPSHLATGPGNDTGSAGPLPPNDSPSFVAEGTTYYTNTTIDDFSPLVTFSNLDSDWLTPLTDSDLSATRPAPPRTWHLGTYKRTEVKNTTIKIRFWGSDIYLYGDTGPFYGAYALALDDGTPSVHTAYNAAQGTGEAPLLHTLHNLSDVEHNLTITNLGTREGLNEGSSFLFDYAIVTQKLGELAEPPKAVDIKGDALSRLQTNGTWSNGFLPDDIVPGEGGIKIALYTERKALWTTENWATLTYNFQGSGVQVFGGRNATHGPYRATLKNTNSSEVVLSETYNNTVPCDEPGQQNIKPSCEWRGSNLKFAVADLDPDTRYELTLQNVHQGNASVLEVDRIRVISLQSVSNDSLTPGEENIGSGARGSIIGADPLTNIFAFFFVFVFVLKALKQ